MTWWTSKLIILGIPMNKNEKSSYLSSKEPTEDPFSSHESQKALNGLGTLKTPRGFPRDS